jgi:hypothetical protein
MAVSANPITPLLKSNWTTIICPVGCYQSEVNKTVSGNVTQIQSVCVCPSELPGQTGDCDAEIEVCQGYVQTIDVAVGFQYSPNANLNYGLLAFVMTAASMAMGYSYTLDSTMNTAWTYNFFWTFLTWGLTFFVWV